MSRWDDIVDYCKEEIKYSASNPRSFEENWGFISSRIRLFSLMILTLLVFGSLVTYLVV